MQINNISTTKELTIVVKFGGMVSLRRAGKTENYKQTKQPVRDGITGVLTKGNVPNEDLKLISKTNSADQIIHIRPETLKHWIETPCSMNQFRSKFGFKTKWFDVPNPQKIEMHINDMVADYAQAASSGSQPLAASWYIQTITPRFWGQLVIDGNQVVDIVPIKKPESQTSSAGKQSIPQQQTLDLRYRAAQQVMVPGTLTRSGEPVWLNVVGYVDLSKFKK